MNGFRTPHGRFGSKAYRALGNTVYTDGCGVPRPLLDRLGDCKRVRVMGLALAMAALPSMAVVPAYAAEEPALSQTAAQTTQMPAALQKIEEIDAQIAKLGATPTDIAKNLAAGKLTRDQELLFLRRSFIYDMGKMKVANGNQTGWKDPNGADDGYNRLVEFAQKDQNHATFLQWLLTDYETLQLYVTGGIPGGRSWLDDGADYLQSLENFYQLAAANPGDMDPKSTSDATDRLVYKKMMISAALGMTNNTKLWTGGAYGKADIAQRYKIIKTLRAHSDQYHFQKALFDQLAVEDMRWVFENRISNEEIPWLVNYTIKQVPNNEGSRLNGYTWIEYRSEWTENDGYKYQGFYDQNQLYTQAKGMEKKDGVNPGDAVQGGWQQKYQFRYDDANFPNQKPGDEFYLDNSLDPASGKQRLWMAFEKGGVCGAVSKTIENVKGASGQPAAVSGQPAHAACAVYSLKQDDATGKMRPFMSIENDSGASWLRLGGVEQNHLLCDWAQVHSEEKGADGKVTNATTRWGDGSFMLLARASLDDMPAYTKAKELLTLASLQSTDAARLPIVEEALAVQPTNWNALLEKVNIYERTKVDGGTWVKFAKEVSDNLVDFPYPMHSFLIRMEQSCDDAVSDAQIEGYRLSSLERATGLTAKDYIQFDAARDTASRLLDRFSTQMFTFSFDGDQPGVIKAGDQLSAEVPWQYSIDGGKTWTQVLDKSKQAQLTSAQLSSMTADNDLKIQIVGVPDQTHTIDLQPALGLEDVGVNEAEGTIRLGRDVSYDSVEICLDGTWQKLPKDKVLAPGTYQLRSVASGLHVSPSQDEYKSVTVSAPKGVEGSQVVMSNELSINDASAVFGGNSADRAINGFTQAASGCKDNGDYWEASSHTDAYVTIDLGKQRTLTSMDLWRRAYGPCGTILSFEVWTAPDGAKTIGGTGADKDKIDQSAFTKAMDVNVEGPKDQNDLLRHITFDHPITGRYIKIRATKVNGNTTSAREFTFYEQQQTAQPQAETGTAQPQAETSSTPAATVEDSPSGEVGHTDAKGSDSTGVALPHTGDASMAAASAAGAVGSPVAAVGAMLYRRRR